MDVLYRRGRATAADVMAELPGEPNYSTVRTQLRVLEDKGHVRHEEEGGRYVYAPAVPRHAARKSALKHLVETFFDGSAEQVVAAVLGGEASRLSDEELDRVSALDRQSAKGRIAMSLMSLLVESTREGVARHAGRAGRGRLPAAAVGGAAPLDPLGRDRRGASRRRCSGSSRPSWHVPLDAIPRPRLIATPAPAPAARVPRSQPRRRIAIRAATQRLARRLDVRSSPPRGSPAPASASSILLVGLGRLAWIASSARRVTSGRWAAAADDVARDYGLRRPVVILQSDHPALLVTWGFVAAEGDPAADRAGLDRRAHSRRAGARVRAHQARRLADPDGGGDRARRLLVQPGDVDRLPAACAWKASRRPTTSCCTRASTDPTTPRTCWSSRAPSRAIVRGCPRRRLPDRRVSRGESAPC